VFITRLTLAHFRNIVRLRLEFKQSINVIYGANALGKTAILEAIYYLAFGKSFRTANTNALIAQGQSHFSVTATVNNDQTTQVSSGRDASNYKIMKVNQKTASQLVLSQALPLQMIYAGDVLSLCTRTDRVKLVDRGVFLYFGQDFAHQYFCYEKLFMQYRAALKNEYPANHLAIIHATMLPYALQIHHYRQKYLVVFQKQLEHYLPMHLKHIEIKYHAGWDIDTDLGRLWTQSLIGPALMYNVFHQGLRYGPQRCNISFCIQQKCITRVLSRGEMKVVMIAIKLSQGSLYTRQHGRPSIYLIDDLSSELDSHYLSYVWNLCRTLGAQVIMTNIAPLEGQFHAINLALALKSEKESHL